VLLFLLLARPLAAKTLPGFTLHFDCIDSWPQAQALILAARDSGAGVLTVVPPAQIWTRPASREILDNIFRLTRRLHMRVLLARIDACPVSADDPGRDNYLYAQILTRPGTLPSGVPTPEYFRATVGLPRYERWLREETAFYAAHYAAEPNLAGFSVGLFNEPFVSQRGSLLCFDLSTNSYELAQYTPSCRDCWHAWLGRRYGDAAAVNERYQTTFSSIGAVPLPANERDPRFGRADAAYGDLVTCINDWVMTQYRECRALWHAGARRPVPFILQFSGYVPEKFAKGRPAFAALDIYAWMQEADALGLSLYTDGKYPDRGHASDAAMVNALYLGVLQKKHLFVMEGGSEDDGAVLIPGELDFFAAGARALQPDCQVYEFTAAPYYATFRHADGYLIDGSGAVNPRVRSALAAGFKKMRQKERFSPAAYVLDDPRSLSASAGDREVAKQLQVIALERALVFVPPASVPLLPRGAALVVVPQPCPPDVAAAAAARGIALVPARDWIRRLPAR
jgi:hypothetical protein